MKARAILSIIIACLFCAPAFAAHPLVTDDTGTQGAGGYSLEVNAEHSEEGGGSETALAAGLSAGATDNLDIVLGVPYVFLSAETEAGDDISESGLSDITLEAKWRFYEEEGLGLALKPGIAFATGDEDKGLGDGKPSYGLFFIATKETESVNLHLNLGYVFNRDELRDVLHYSIAAEYPVREKLTIAGNLGGETNADKQSDTNPLFLLGGLIYKATDSLDIDIGIKAGLNEAEPDYTLLAGITIGL